MCEDDEAQLYMAHERIRFLNRELVMQEDPLVQAKWCNAIKYHLCTEVFEYLEVPCLQGIVQIAALKRKITLSQERAQEIVSMANKRIAYLSELWREPSQKDFVRSEIAPSSSLLPSEGEKLSDFSCSNYNAIQLVFSRAIAALDNISLSKAKVGDLRNEAARIASDIRNFLPMLSGQNTPKSKESTVSSNESTTPNTTARSRDVNTTTTDSTSLSTGIASSTTSENAKINLNTAKAVPPPTALATTTSVLVLPTTPPPKTAEQEQNGEAKPKNGQPPSTNNH